MNFEKYQIIKNKQIINEVYNGIFIWFYCVYFFVEEEGISICTNWGVT